MTFKPSQEQLKEARQRVKERKKKHEEYLASLSHDEREAYEQACFEEDIRLMEAFRPLRERANRVGLHPKEEE